MLGPQLVFRDTLVGLLYESMARANDLQRSTLADPLFGSGPGGGIGAGEEEMMGEEKKPLVCIGRARVLVGNPSTVNNPNRPGGLSPDPRNGPPLLINEHSASIIPRQFASTSDNVRPVLRQIAFDGQKIVGTALDGPFAGMVLF